MQKRYLVPNLFTGLNFLLGIFSIVVMTESFTSADPTQHLLGFSKPPMVLGAWMIVWCVLFDKLDGFAAKILKASSDFGAQFDSLADLVAFGVAPGFLVYFTVQLMDPLWFNDHRPLMIISMAVYVLCASLRLARYNSVDSEELVNYFHGLPSTFAGGWVAVNILLIYKHNMIAAGTGQIIYLPLILIFTGILMVSPLYLPKLVRRKGKWLNLIQIIGIVLGYSSGFGMIYPEFLMGGLLTYGAIGFTYGFLQKGLIAPAATPPNSD